MKVSSYRVLLMLWGLAGGSEGDSVGVGGRHVDIVPQVHGGASVVAGAELVDGVAVLAPVLLGTQDHLERLFEVPVAQRVDQRVQAAKTPHKSSSNL